MVVNDSQTIIAGVIDQYILQHHPQSILCTPILNQGSLVGVLYLENRSTKNVFNRDRPSNCSRKTSGSDRC
ncbi:GAF domain-containing protein [Nostoc paludosum FACHB-159]|uniref:GAF domain-containing protein n=2 Tax=Nostoc TaxID=1177 RepID=A0ABR8KED7_9NOSO|nr:GAF domain-containing protein [Nostoc sp. FACHB-857]MBD2737929.1 GAF domain-containing protein [Nostoc paludosum FACHB-159]